MILELDLPCGRKFFIDEADAHLLNGKLRHAAQRGQTYYVRLREPGQSKCGRYLHNLIIGGRTDHRDGNGLNNTRDNLRPCTQHQNTLNKRVKHNKQYKGVYRRGPSYRAQIYYEGRAYNSRACKTAEDAALAYDEMALRLHGEFARLNFPDRKDARQGELLTTA